MEKLRTIVKIGKIDSLDIAELELMVKDISALTQFPRNNPSIAIRTIEVNKVDYGISNGKRASYTIKDFLNESQLFRGNYISEITLAGTYIDSWNKLEGEKQ